ncbi:MAG: transglutaminase domain-containing protein [Clostridia bacterium]|nr:transglutaminase domain-containing protein [Clostridia bacterium]
MTDKSGIAVPERDDLEWTPEPSEIWEPEDDGDAGDEAELALLDEAEAEAVLRERRSIPDKVHKVPIVLSAVLLALFAAAAVTACVLAHGVFSRIGPVSAAIDETVDYPVLHDAFWGRFCKADPPVAEIDTSSVGERQGGVRAFGFLRKIVTVTVEDRIPPEFETSPVVISPGEFPDDPADFVRAWVDQTALTFAFAGDPEPSENGLVSIAATDESGNRTEHGAPLTVTEQVFRHERGASRNGLIKSLKAAVADGTWDVSSVEANTPGTYPVRGDDGEVRYFLTVTVSDTTPPTAEPDAHDILCGERPDASLFAKEIKDASPVTVRYRTEPDFDTPGEGTVALLLEDEAGNRTELDVPVMCWDFMAMRMIEYGTTPEEIVDLVLTSSLPTDEVRILSGFNSSLGETGLHELTLSGRYSSFTLTVETEDTVPPDATVHDLDLLLGERAELDDFVTDVRDYSGATAVYVREPDFGAVGEQQVDVLLEDGVGNRKTVTAALCIWDIPAALTVESGTTLAELRSLLFEKHGEGSLPAIADADDLADRQPGEYALTLSGEHADMSITLTVEDTTPPALTTKALTVYVGEAVDPWGLVASATDRAPVIVTFEKAPDTASEGNRTVTLVARDPYGNETRADAVLTVIADHDPPVIYGTADQKVLIGGTVSFRKNVWAEDARDGSVNVTVDSSAVNLNAVGVYPVVYYASDASGNTATATAYITVADFDEDTVRSYADAVLAQILPWGGTEREKAKAVYDYVSKSVRYSTSTAHLMGQYWRAAYSAFTTYAGNGYTYYAMSSVLLTRAGIENIMVSRNDPNHPHYWNLVKVDGNWYHFDACPHYAGFDLYSFLLTDAQVIDYSTYQVAGYYSFDASLYPATP